VVLALLGAASVGFAADQGFEKLEGRWRRADGGYVLDIRKVRPDGAIDAAYLNPRPINVSKAQATRDGATGAGLRRAPRAELPGEHLHVDV
jgi:hypothetical protein